MTTVYPLLRSLFKNSIEPIECNVEGKIPEWLTGTLFRNGPGRYQYDDKAYEHLFDGHAVIHKFSVEKGKVFYSNRFVESKSFEKSVAENRLYPVFGTPDVCSNLFGRVKTLFVTPETLDNTNVHILPFAKEHLYALTETNFIHKINPVDLKVQSKIDLHAFIPTLITSSAHPHVDNDGSWIVTGVNKKMQYLFIKYDANSKNLETKSVFNSGKILATIPSNRSLGYSYSHSFSVTKNYIVFLEGSMKLCFKALLASIFTNKSFSDSLFMEPDWQTRIHIINKETGEIIQQKFITDPLFTFHHINAYEEHPDINNKNLIDIIVDICAYDPNKYHIKEYNCSNIYTDELTKRGLSKSVLKRIKINLNLESNSLDTNFCPLIELNSDVIFELPTINYSRYNGLPYKYFYGVNHYKKPYSIIKMNVENPAEIFEMKYVENDRQFLPSEPIFVENPYPTSEDDGVLLVMVLNETNDYLSILDAKNLKEIAKAVLPVECKSAVTFHGFFAEKTNFKNFDF